MCPTTTSIITILLVHVAVVAILLYTELKDDATIIADNAASFDQLTSSFTSSHAKLLSFEQIQSSLHITIY